MTVAHKWVEISVTVEGELAEAVAEVFSRFAPQGVVIESTAIADDPQGEGHPIGPLRVCVYLPNDQDYAEKQRRLEDAIWYLGRISPLPELHYRPVGDVDWVSAWKQHYRPIPVGKRLIILPDWIEEHPPNRIPIKIYPGMAFGTGAHPTTQLCLQMVENIIISTDSPVRDYKIIDIGCGSGILSIAALKLGAQRALGVDVDPQAIENARQNAAANRVSERLELGVGSIPDILAGRFSCQQGTLVFANILASVIIQLFGEGLVKLVTPGGSLILSGILSDQTEAVERAAGEQGFTTIDRQQMGDWIALLAEKS